MKFELKQEFNLLGFLKTVDYCEGNVMFETLEGDRLDLKSQLSKYLFLTVKPGDSCLINSRIECSKEDAQRLAEFLVISG